MQTLKANFKTNPKLSNFQHKFCTFLKFQTKPNTFCEKTPKKAKKRKEFPKFIQTLTKITKIM